MSQTKQGKLETLNSNTKQKVLNYYGEGLVKSKFLLGETLSEYKGAKYTSNENFDELVETLPFGKTQADKYVSLYECEWVRNLVFSEFPVYTHNFPSSFTTLYKLTQKKFYDNEDLKSAFVQGSFTKNVDGELQTFKTSELTSEDFDNFFGNNKPKKSSEATSSSDNTSSDSSNDNEETKQTPFTTKGSYVKALFDLKSTVLSDFETFNKVKTFLKDLKCDGLTFDVDWKSLEKFEKQVEKNFSEKVVQEAKAKLVA